MDMFYVRNASGSRVAARRFFEGALDSMRRAGIGSKIVSRDDEVVFATCIAHNHAFLYADEDVGHAVPPGTTGAVLGVRFSLPTMSSVMIPKKVGAG